MAFVPLLIVAKLSVPSFPWPGRQLIYTRTFSRLSALVPLLIVTVLSVASAPRPGRQLIYTVLSLDYLLSLY
jgi:hypothetical protein